MTVRVRFAPSPTGHLHIGGVRTAIFNWLFARHHGGTFILRIEDTDLERSLQEYTDSLCASLEWLGIVSDEPVIIQSSRRAEHARVLESLLSDGRAYRCYCTQDEVKARLRAHGESDEFIRYDGHCRTRPYDATRSAAIRFKLPDFASLGIAAITFNDSIRGEVSFPVDQLDDFIIARSDGSPMYNFVVVVDDMYSAITHVIRGEEHLGNTPKQILLYQALQGKEPQFAHIPLILNKEGGKLSKRDGAVSALAYKEQGYLADALFNYLVRLGWSHGDQELFTRAELIQYFTLAGVGKKGAVFDPDKLLWVNSVYIRDAQPADLLNHIACDVSTEYVSLVEGWSSAQQEQLCALYQPRVKTLEELARILIALHRMPQVYDVQGMSAWVTEHTGRYMEELIAAYTALAESQWTEPMLTQIGKQVCTDAGIKLPYLAQPLRLALTGTTESPGVFGLLVAFGKEESLRRLTLFVRCL